MRYSRHIATLQYEARSIGPNDEVERRGASPASNEGTLSQPSTPGECQGSVARFKRPPVNLLSADLEPRGRSGSSREWHGSSAQDFQPERADKVDDASRG